MATTLDCVSILSEAAVDVNRIFFSSLSEDAKIQVTDDVLTGMFKFVTDKYNALDFGEIEKSAGDISRFKYTGMIEENAAMLANIYTGCNDPGAKKYLEVTNAVQTVINHLRAQREAYGTLYKAGNGVVQLLYVSLVSACLYAIGTLVSNTIRFVTTEQETDCQVLYDEIPGTVKHVHIKNILACANDIPTFEKLLHSYMKPQTGSVMKESVTLTGVTAALIGTAAVIYLIPRVLVLIREIIYSVYYMRVRVSDMLAVQVDLINTNVESLEAGRGSKKVIARQKKIADKLAKWSNIIAVKMDTTNTLVKSQKTRENAALKVDRNSPIVQEPEYAGSGDILL